MAQQPNEDKKPDFSNFPRGAIGLRGLPLSRNTRLPSFRTPRDLTLGCQPKRTFIPNIPVRREKKPSAPEKESSQSKGEYSMKNERKNSPFQNERNRGRGRGRGQLIQTQGSVFGEGFSVDYIPQKEKLREAYTRISTSSTDKVFKVKREKVEAQVSGISDKLSDLCKDDFDDDDEMVDSKPIIFPMQDHLKVEKKEEIPEFNHNVAQEMNFNIEQVAKFIKKEKDGDEPDVPVPATVVNPPEKDPSGLFTNSIPQMVLLQFPVCMTTRQKNNDLDYSQRGQSSTENNPSDDQKSTSCSLSSLPEGHIGKLQLLKSGKARLLLGSLTFDLDSINSLQSKHEVVSIRTNSNNGDLMVLGSMVQKLKFAPDVESLLS